MRVLNLVILVCLSFARLSSMEVPQDENDNNSNKQTIHPQSLSKIVARYLAKKLMKDVRNSAQSLFFRGTCYKKYLQSCSLTPEAKKLILKELINEEPNILWRVLNYEAFGQDLDVTVQDIIVLEDKKLLVHYKEQAIDADLNGVSKIRIWDVKINGWSTIDLPLSEVNIYKWLISKNLKTLFLWCEGDRIVIYDLQNKKVFSEITLSVAITSFCLLNDQFICCGLANGSVKVFNKDTNEEVYEFQAGTYPVSLIATNENKIFTENGGDIGFWEIVITENDIKCTEISTIYRGNIKDLIGGLNNASILIHFDNQSTRIGGEVLKDYQPIKGHWFLDICLMFKKSSDGTMIIVGLEDLADAGKNLLKALLIFDPFSGERIKEIKLEDEKLSIHSWENFAISDDKSFIVLYNRGGNILKISLNLDEDFESTLKTIKSSYNPWCCIS